MNVLRSTTEYAQAKALVSEKRLLQSRLREVDRMLRELRILKAGVTELAMKDCERELISDKSDQL